MKISEGFPKLLEEGGVTAKIYKGVIKGKYDLFTLAFYQDGKFTKENFGNLEDAIERGKKVIRNLKSGEFGGTVMTIEDTRAYLNALKNLEPTGFSLESATKDFAAAVKMLGGVPLLEAVKYYAKRHEEKVEARTVQQVVDEFLAAKEAGMATRIKGKGKTVSERYIYDLRKKLEKVAAHFNGLMISLVTAEEINRFVHEIRGVKGRPKRKRKDGDQSPRPVSGRTKNNYIQTINVLLEFAKKQKYVPRDFSVMDEVDQAEEEEFEIEIFKAEEITKILAAARPEALPALVIGAFAGIRTAEVCRLDWSEVNLESRLIEIKKGKAKTRSRRLVPITDNLALFLKELAQKSGPVWGHSEPFLFDLMRDAGKDSGVPWKHNALRHSFISYRVAKNKNVNEVAMEAGNSPEMIFKHYRELVTEKEANDWFNVTPAAVAAFKRQQEAEKAAKVVEMPKTVAA